MNKTKIAPFTVYFDQSEEFHQLKREVFGQNVYYFETDNPFPRILDIGAYIGLTTLYFKKIYPGAHITVIEPNPDVIPLLEQNIWENNLKDVEVVPVAISDQVGRRTLHRDQSSDRWWSTASFQPGAWNQEQQTEPLMVDTLPLHHFLHEPVDFLKLDVEGAEQFILTHSQKHLHNVRHLMLEFHPTSEQSLPELVKLLSDHHFTVKLWKHGREVTIHQAKGLIYLEAKSTQ